MDRFRRIQGCAEILCERALAASVETGDPDSDFRHMPAADAFPERVEEFPETCFDIVRNLVLGYLAGEAVLLLRIVVDDLFDGPVDRPAG